MSQVATGKKGRKNWEVTGMRSTVPSKERKASLRIKAASAMASAKVSRATMRTHCRSLLCHLCDRNASIVSWGLKDREIEVRSFAVFALVLIRLKRRLRPEGGI